MLRIDSSVLKEYSTEQAVFLITKEEDIKSFESIRKGHKNIGYKLVDNMLFAYRNASKFDDDVRWKIGKVVEVCNVCKKYTQYLEG